MTSSEHTEADEDRAGRQERAQRAAAGRQPALEAPGDPETLAQRAATAQRTDGPQA